MLRFLGNVIWFLLGGLILSILWFLFGILWCITIIGIPLGKQCFKFAKLTLTPFGKTVRTSQRTFPLLVNVIWILLSGGELAILHASLGLAFCVTIVGIPFGLQHFKLAELALFPFGSEVE